MASAESLSPHAGRHDPGVRKRALRKGRERGCSVYLAAEQLQAAGVPLDRPLYYRVWEAPGRPRFIINLYTEP